MPKAASPVRLERTLMDAAAVEGSLLHRSAAEQIEYWADIGRKISGVITPSDLLAISAGLMKISLEETSPVTADPDAVFATLGRERDGGGLARTIAGDKPRYQASHSHPGLLEQVMPDGSTRLGQFRNGEFEEHLPG